MIMLRDIVLGLALAAGLGAAAVAQAPAPGALPPGSQVPVGNSVISYIEVVAGSEAKALAALKALKTASAKDAGFVSFTVLQRTNQPYHFALVEHWRDNAAREAHLKQPHVQAARDALKPLETAPYDERPHRDLSTGQNNAAGGAAVYSVTHVDFVPAFREKGEEMLQSYAFESRRLDGNARFDVYTQASRPNHMTIIAVWNSADAWRKHAAAPSSREFREALLPRSGSLYDERIYRVVN